MQPQTLIDPNDRKKILIKYNLSFWIIIISSIGIIWAVFNPFYDPQGLSWPIVIGIIAILPIILVAFNRVLYQYYNHRGRLALKLKFSGLGILFLVIMAICLLLALSFIWLGARLTRMRVDLGSVYITIAPIATFVVYYFTNRLILRIDRNVDGEQAPPSI